MKTCSPSETCKLHTRWELGGYRISMIFLWLVSSLGSGIPGLIEFQWDASRTIPAKSEAWTTDRQDLYMWSWSHTHSMMNEIHITDWILIMGDFRTPVEEGIYTYTVYRTQLIYIGVFFLMWNFNNIECSLLCQLFHTDSPSWLHGAYAFYKSYPV